MAVAAFLGLASAAHAAAADDLATLVEADGARGGLCLVVGAKDMNLANTLSGAFYVQVLQPDAKLAAAWSAAVANSPNRENIGIRTAAFDPDHYGSDLFNLVILSDAAGAADPKAAAGLARILTPGGVLVLAGKDAPAGLTEAGLEAKPAPNGWALLGKKPGAIGAFAPCDSLRWRAGSRWQQISDRDFVSVAFGAGKLIFREGMAVTNGQNRFEMTCRDAYNGRLLWRIEEEPFPGRPDRRLGVAISENNRVYTGLGKDLVCLDAMTGKVLEVLKPGGRPGNVYIHKNKYLLVDGRILDLADHKELGKFGGGSMAVCGDVVCSSGDGRQIGAHQIPDGKMLWQVAPTNQPGGQFGGLFASDTALHVQRTWPAASLSTMDPATGATLWTYPPEPRPKVRDVLAYPFGDKLIIAYNDSSITEKHDFVLKQVEAKSGKVLRDKIFAPGKKWSGGCWGPRPAGEYLLYHYNLWLHTQTAARTYGVMFRPTCAQGPRPAYGMIYGFAGRKGGAIKGVAALAPRDIDFNDQPGGQVLKTHAPAPAPLPAATAADWPIFRASPARGNAASVSPGKTLALKWTAPVGLGKRTHGTMDAERTGLTQAVSAWGLAVVADIEGQRVVALDAASGAIKWTFAVGARVDFPPVLHEGLCLFSAKDGWAYCLDAKTGSLVYKLLIAPRERYIGGEEAIQSMWPGCGDVLVVDGVAYSSAGVAASIHGGIRVVAFKPRTGETIWSRCLQGVPTINDQETQPNLIVWDEKSKQLFAAGKALDPATGKDKPGRGGKGVLNAGNMEDWLATNNRHRLSEDQGASCITSGEGGIAGRMIAFSDTFGIGFNVPRIEKSVLHVGPLNIAGKSTDGQAKWAMPPTELNVDDFLVSPDAVYVVGHYEKGEGPAELWVVSPADGKILSSQKLDIFPAYNGMSAAGSQLFVATRDGKLLCFAGK